MARAAAGTWSTATNLADELVRTSSLSFREAHSLVARLVRNSLRDSVGTDEVGSAHLAAAAKELDMPAPSLGADAIRAALDARGFANTRLSHGGISPPQVAALAAEARDVHAEQSAWLSARNTQASDAAALLAGAVEGFR